MNPAERLPVENFCRILGYLNIQELALCHQVSKAWNRISSDDYLWRRLFPEISIPKDVNSRQYLKDHIVVSKFEIVRRIQKFVARMSLNQKGSFTCFFPFQKDCTITAEMGIDLKGEFRLKESCFFMRPILDDEQGLGNQSFAVDGSYINVKVVLPSSYKFFDRILGILEEGIKRLELEERKERSERLAMYVGYVIVTIAALAIVILNIHS